VLGSILYAKLLAIPLVISYHTHVPEYIPKYTWRGFVRPMWSLIRFCSRAADLTLVTSKVMQVRVLCFGNKMHSNDDKSGCPKGCGASRASAPGWPT